MGEEGGEMEKEGGERQESMDGRDGKGERLSILNGCCSYTTSLGNFCVHIFSMHTLIRSVLPNTHITSSHNHAHPHTVTSSPCRSRTERRKLTRTRTQSSRTSATKSK